MCQFHQAKPHFLELPPCIGLAMVGCKKYPHRRFGGRKLGSNHIAAHMQPLFLLTHLVDRWQFLGLFCHLPRDPLSSLPVPGPSEQCDKTSLSTFFRILISSRSESVRTYRALCHPSGLPAYPQSLPLSLVPSQPPSLRASSISRTWRTMAPQRLLNQLHNCLS